MKQNILGDNIRERREALGLSRAELADTLGLTLGAVGHYENGIRTPDPQRLLEISKILDVSMETLLTQQDTAITA